MGYPQRTLIRADIGDFNAAYLLQLKAMASTDMAGARAVFGVALTEGEAVRGLSVAELQRLAPNGMMLFRPKALLQDGGPAVSGNTDLAELNFAYLLFLQRIAQSSLADAEMRFGIAVHEAQGITGTPVLALRAYASRGTMFLEPRSLFRDLVAGATTSTDRAGAILRVISGDL